MAAERAARGVGGGPPGLETCRGPATPFWSDAQPASFRLQAAVASRRCVLPKATWLSSDGPYQRLWFSASTGHLK